MLGMAIFAPVVVRNDICNLVRAQIWAEAAFESFHGDKLAATPAVEILRKILFALRPTPNRMPHCSIGLRMFGENVIKHWDRRVCYQQRSNRHVPKWKHPQEI